MTIEAVVLDVNGLLVESAPVRNDARPAMAARCHKPWTHEGMGVSTDEWTAFLIERLELTHAPQGVRNDVTTQMEAMYRRQIPFRPFAVEAVQWAADEVGAGISDPVV